MNRKLTAVALALSAALLSPHAFADCDGTSDDAKRLLAEGKAFEPGQEAAGPLQVPGGNRLLLRERESVRTGGCEARCAAGS